MPPKHDEIAISRSVAELCVQATILDPEHAEDIRRILEQQFAGPGPPIWLWDRLRNAVTTCREDGWAKATEYVGADRAILFLDRSNGTTMWLFESGVDIRDVLSNCPVPEIYLTDPDLTYVLCFNHHDCLIGVGACAAWLSALDDEGVR